MIHAIKYFFLHRKINNYGETHCIPFLQISRTFLLEDKILQHKLILFTSPLFTIMFYVLRPDILSFFLAI